MRHDKLIDRMGGPTVVAHLLGYTYPSVISRWRKRGIPPHIWPTIVPLAQAQGIKVSVDALLKFSPLPYIPRDAA